MQEKKDPQPKSASSLGKVGQISQWLTQCFSSQCLCVFQCFSVGAAVCASSHHWCLAVFTLLNESQHSELPVGRAGVLMCISVCVWWCSDGVSVWLCVCVWCDFLWSICFEVHNVYCVVMNTYTFFSFAYMYMQMTLYCKVWRPCRAPNLEWIYSVREYENII